MPALNLSIPHVRGEPAICASLLDEFRLIAMVYRSSPRIDLYRACKLIDPEPSVAVRAYSTALVRTLSQALGKRPDFRAPGSEPGFDELWLMRLIERALAADGDSVAFMLRSRVAPHRRPAFAHLIDGLARNLTEAP